MTTLRPATADDLRAIAGKDPDPAWCAQWFGFTAEADGKIAGIGITSRDMYGRCWVWVEVLEPLSALFLHRIVRTSMVELRKAGIGALHAYCSASIPTAEGWLTRLGFRPDPSLPCHPDGRPVWKCDL